MTKDDVVRVIPACKLLDNYVENSANFSVSTTVHRATVPAGKRWYLVGGQVSRDVSAIVTIVVNNASDKMIAYVATYSAATTTVSFFKTESGTNVMAAPYRLPMKAGDYIQFTFAVAQGAAATLSAIVEEVIAL